MPGDLEGKTALVTGASRGIGAATALALDRSGARVALVSRDASALDAVAGELTHDPVVIVGDLRESAAPAEIATAALSAFGGVDILVNNAAAARRLPFLETDASLLDELLAVNIRSPLLLIAALIPAMIERGGGSIINISSVSALRGTPRRAGYAASKAGMDAATRSLAIEFGPSGIRVNSLAPGVVDTALWEKNKAIPGVTELINEMTPLRRWATPEDIAEVVVFLASDRSRFITGETIAADGGMAATLDLYGGPV